MNLGSAAFIVGVDVSFEALQKAQIPNALWVCAKGEQLPFGDGCFDCVVSAVALPYMDIPRALQEMRRVLAPSGALWTSLHSFRMASRHWLHSLRTLDLGDVVFRAYVLLNGLAFYLSGRVFRFPLNPALCESFQTRRGMRLALRRAGFLEEEIVKFFVAAAKSSS
jgi:SAM-dependent methyltransferase